MADFLDAIFSSKSEIVPEPELAAPPPAVPQPTAPQGPTKSSVLEAKLHALETELARERERAKDAEMRIKQGQEAQATVEQTLEKMYEKMARERNDQEMRVIREKATARVDALENRLDEFQKGILELLKQNNETRQKKEHETVQTAQGSLERRFAAFQQQVLEVMRDFTEAKEKAIASYFKASQDQITGAINHMRSQTADGDKLKFDSLSTLREELKLLSAKVEQTNAQSKLFMSNRLMELDQKISQAGKVMQARTQILSAIEKIDPLLVDKATFDELQQIKENLKE